MDANVVVVAVVWLLSWCLNLNFYLFFERGVLLFSDRLSLLLLCPFSRRSRHLVVDCWLVIPPSTHSAGPSPSHPPPFFLSSASGWCTFSRCGITRNQEGELQPTEIQLFSPTRIFFTCWSISRMEEMASNTKQERNREKCRLARCRLHMRIHPKHFT
jgi:hypothetical protein